MLYCIEEDGTTSPEFALLMKQYSACVEPSTGTVTMYGVVEDVEVTEYGCDSSRANL
jgi:hypothetical protein